MWTPPIRKKKESRPRNRFTDIFGELVKYMNLSLVTELLLQSLVVFLVFYLLLSIVSFYARAAFFIAFIYFIVKAYTRARSERLNSVESQYPDLQERLRTAREYGTSQNPLAIDLREDVSKLLRSVGIASLFNSKKIVSLVLVSVLLCITIIFSSLFNSYFIDMKVQFSDTVDKIPDLFESGLDRLDGLTNGAGGLFDFLGIGEDERAGSGAFDDIYGDESLAALGEKKVDLEIDPVGFTMDLENEGDLPDEEFKDAFPSSFEVAEAESYTESISEENKEVVKKYFELLAVI